MGNSIVLLKIVLRIPVLEGRKQAKEFISTLSPSSTIILILIIIMYYENVLEKE